MTPNPPAPPRRPDAGQGEMLPDEHIDYGDRDDVPEPTGLHQCPDAKVWADYFMLVKAKHPGIANSRDCMLGWFANAMEAMRDALAPRAPAPPSPATTAGGWIACSERLPDFDSNGYGVAHCLAYSDTWNHPSTADFFGGAWYDSEYMGEFPDHATPTHWMPLPSPPTEQKT